MCQVMLKNSPKLFEQSLRKGDMKKNKASYMQLACVLGKAKMVKYFFEKGVGVMGPPNLSKFDREYRRSPFIIQTVKSGSIETLIEVESRGGQITDQGCICLSRQQGNIVISNTIGCAAYHGQTDMLKYLLSIIP